MNNSRNRRVFLFSIPRSRSNMLIKLLEGHPALATWQYPFEVAFNAGPARKDQVDDPKAMGSLFGITDPNAEEFSYQGSFDKLQKFIAKTEHVGKIPVIKEHMYAAMRPDLLYTDGRLDGVSVPIADRMLDVTAEVDGLEGKEADNFPGTLKAAPNPTILPDRFLHTLSPIILIRHPARVVASFLRAGEKLGQTTSSPWFDFGMTFRYQRALLDYWNNTSDDRGSETEQGWPAVIDGDRLVTDPEGVMKRLCERIHIDPTLIKYTWAQGHQVNKITEVVSAAFFDQIRSSTGINADPDVAKAPDLEAETKKWAAEWDEETAEKLRGLVEAALGDYEYVLQFHV